NAPAAAVANGTLESHRALGLASPSSSPLSAVPEDRSRLAQYAQQGQFVAGKNFFQNDKHWIDSAVQKQPGARRKHIKFASNEYFKLIAAKPKASQWLALGQNVQFVLDDTLYEIYE